MKKYALIVAGGSGTRIGSDIPKQFIPIGGLPILMHTINQFSNFNSTISIFLVLPENQFQYWKQLCEDYNYKTKITLIAGGNTRFQSVKNGLEAIKEDGIVAIHDGVRPFISDSIIENNYNETLQHGNALTVVDLKDSIRNSTKSLNRSDYKLVQTPQTFIISEIKKAYSEPEKDFFTDDASVYESTGRNVNLVEGDYKNIKITTPEDIIIANAFLD